MVRPIDLEISAKVFIGEYGPGAHAYAKDRAEQLRKDGDSQGAATFEQIARSVRRLQNIANDNPTKA